MSSFICGSTAYSYRRRAMRTLRRLDRNGGEAEGTVFSGRSRSGGGCLEPIHLLHEHEDHERDDDEIQYGLQKHTVIDGGSAGRLGRCERGLRSPREIQKKAGKIHFAQEQTKWRHQNVTDKRCDDLAKGPTDDHPDGHVEDIALHGELFELFQHTVLLSQITRLAFPRGIERVPERDEIQIVGVPGARRRLAVVAGRYLEAADEPFPDLEADSVVHRHKHIGYILERGKQFTEMIDGNAVVEKRPIPLHRNTRADTRRVSGSVEIFIEIRQPGFRVEGHVFGNARVVVAVDPLIAGSAGERGSQFEVLEFIAFKISRRKPEESLRDEEVQLDGGSSVPGEECACVITVHIANVHGEPQEITPSD